MKIAASGNHIIVKINRQAQKDKSTVSASGLIVPPGYEYMQYNLQYGEIVSIGDTVTLPEIKLGRQAIFHHMIESEDTWMIPDSKEENGDHLRFVAVGSNTYSYKYYGVIDENKKIIPSPQHVFCHPEGTFDTGEKKVYEEMDIDPNTPGAGKMSVSISKKGRIYLAELPPTVTREKLFDTTEIAFVHTDEQYVKPGHRILTQDFTKYPISLFGKEYWIFLREHILVILNYAGE